MTDNLRLGACQFAVTGDIKYNIRKIEDAIYRASELHVDLLAFPECALTGYPPINLTHVKPDFSKINAEIDRIRCMVNKTGVACLVGSVAEEQGKQYNRSYFIIPGGSAQYYDKRILGGWDAEYFCEGKNKGIFTWKEYRFAVRICFEIRFPELFREIYREECDFIVAQFYDTSVTDNPEYYSIIRSHLSTRAAENLTPILSVNTNSPFQEAPTAFVDSDGIIMDEAARGTDTILIHNFRGRGVTASGERRRKWIDRMFLQNEHY